MFWITDNVGLKQTTDKLGHRQRGDDDPVRRLAADGCERSIKIKLKIKKTYFENKSNTILKIKDLAAKIKWFSSKN